MRRACLPRPRRARSARLAVSLLVAGMAVAVPAAAAEGQVPIAEERATGAVHHRVFLQDGPVLISYGEFARVGSDVVFLMPVGGTESEPQLHIVTLSEAEVDWQRTDAYARALRAQHYAETRGEIDFARLTREVTGLLQQAGLVSDSATRLTLAERARRQLIEWPRHHYDYRADEIAQLGTWLDQVVSELRIAAGQSSFDLAFVAPLPAAARIEPLLAPPAFRERAELALVAAARTADPVERTALLGAVLDALRPGDGDTGWMAGVRARAATALAAELRVDRAYADLSRRALARADAYVRQANVRALDGLIATVLDEDARLQRARPAAVTALLATLDVRMTEARRLRLARDAWAMRRAIVLDYWTSIREPLDRLLGIRVWLTDVRQLAGPAPRSVQRLSEHALRAAEELARIRPAPEVASVHATFAAAAALAARASAVRLEAIRSGNMETAWQASSAAAGSLLLLEQALDDLRQITYAPAP